MDLAQGTGSDELQLMMNVVIITLAIIEVVAVLIVAVLFPINFYILNKMDNILRLICTFS